MPVHSLIAVEGSRNVEHWTGNSQYVYVCNSK